MLGVLTSTRRRRPLVSEDYDGPQVVGLDLHRNRTVMVRMTPSGDVLESVRFANDAQVLTEQIGKAGEAPEVVLEATYGWYWAVDALQATGASVHLAHPLGVKGFGYRRVKNDYRDAADLADLLRMGRLPEAWIATAEDRDRRELVRHRHKLVQMRTSLAGSGWVRWRYRSPSVFGSSLSYG
jgi:transposase